MKLIKILGTIFLHEGIDFDDNGNVVITQSNTGYLKHNPTFSDKQGANVYHSFEYNHNYLDNNEKTSKAKKAADDLKSLNIPDEAKYELKSIIKNDIQKAVGQTGIGKPQLILSLDSSKGLTQFVADIAQELYDIDDENMEIIGKVEWDDWKDLIKDDANITSPAIRKGVEAAAKKMITSDGKYKMKSTGLAPQFRQYFKPKYELDKIINRIEAQQKILVVDDNVQTGKDLGFISKALEQNKKIFAPAMYVPILLAPSTRKTTKKKTTEPYWDIINADSNSDSYKYTKNGTLFVTSNHKKYLNLLNSPKRHKGIDWDLYQAIPPERRNSLPIKGKFDSNPID